MKKLLLAALMVPTICSAQAPKRVPLYEVFTSSTCPPCKPANESYEQVLTGKPVNDYVSIKYQQSFPGNGDPYTTQETKARFNLYGLGGVPHMMIDGGWDQHAGQFTNTEYTSSHAVAPKFNLSGAYTQTLSDKKFTIKVDATPLSAAVTTGAVLHVAIIEKETEQNVKSNLETKFYNVVKKMVPTNTGTNLTGLVMNTKKTTNLTFEFKGNYRLPTDGKTNYINWTTEHSVEQFNDLKVVAWVQNTTTKEVYQAANLMKVNSLGVDAFENTMTDVKVFPNPAANTVNINFAIKNADNMTALIINLEGQVVASKSADMKPGTNQLSINTANLASGFYNLVLVDSQNNSYSEKLSIVH